MLIGGTQEWQRQSMSPVNIIINNKTSDIQSSVDVNQSGSFGKITKNMFAQQ
jgi:hypothetical protein